MADGYGMDYRPLGTRFGGGNSYRLAQLLSRQNYNNGTNAGGLANVLQQALMGMAIKGENDQAAKLEGDTTAANNAMVQGMTAQPWKLPAGEQNFSGPTTDPNAKPMPFTAAPAGGYEGGLAALQNLGGDNAPAGKLSQALLMHGVDQQEKQAADARAQQRALDLKAAPGWEKPTPPPTVSTAEGVFNRNTDGSLGTRLGGAPSLVTLNQPPTGYSPGPNGSLTATPGGPADPATIQARAAAEAAAKPKEDKTVSAETAKTIGLLDSGLNGVQDLRKLAFNPDGELNSEAVLASRLPWGGLSESGKKIATAAYMAADAELRLKTGAQAPQSEIERSARALMPDITDNKETANAKLAALENYLKSVDKPLRPDRYKTPPAGAPAAPGNVPPPPPGFVVHP